MSNEELYKACYNDSNLEKVSRLLAQKCDVNYTNSNGCFPLYRATEYGCVGIVAKLLEHKADVMKRNTSCGSTALHMACFKGHAAMIPLLVKHNPNVIDQTRNGGYTALRMACENDKVDLVCVLLEHKADVTKKAKNGETAVQIAQRRDNERIMLLLSNITPADFVHHTMKDGRPLLHVACQHGAIEVVKALLEHKADVTKRTKDGESALHIACKCGKVDIIALLVKNNDDVIHEANNEGKTALHFACELGNANVVQALLEHQADVGAQIPSNGNTALHVACQNGKMDLVPLLKHNADPFQENEQGDSPFLLACFHNHYEFLPALLAAAGSSCGFLSSAMLMREAHKDFSKSPAFKDLLKVWCSDPTKSSTAVPSQGAGLRVPAKPMARQLKDLTEALQTETSKYDEVKRKYDQLVVALKSYQQLSSASSTQDQVQLSPEVLKSLKAALLEEKETTETQTNDSSFHEACEKGDLKELEAELARGVNHSAVDANGLTGLHRSVKAGQMAVLQKLIDMRADVNKTDNEGTSALQTAVRNGSEPMVRLMLEKGESYE